MPKSQRPSVLLIRSVPIPRDPRALKMVADYRQRGWSVRQAFWSRGESFPAAADTFVHTRAGRYGARWGNLAALLSWQLYIIRTMWVQRRAIDIVHCVDFDSGLSIVPIARLLGKAIVYDAYDQFAAGFRNSWLRRLFATAERLLLRLSDVVIFPDEIRLEQYGVAPDARQVFISNIPDMQALEAVPRRNRERSGRLRLSYVGTLEPVHRGLEFLPELCAALPGHIECVVAGNGPLEPLFADAAARLRNLTFHGRVDYPTALSLMAAADCLYGAYLLTTPAHRYAAPNKLYEHLALGLPLITNEGGPPGTFVQQNRSGFVFGGSLADLIHLMNSVDRQKCEQAGQAAASRWQSNFRELRSRQVGTFFDCISSVMNKTPT